MKYLLVIAVVAGSLYQLYLPKLTDESVRRFMDDMQIAEQMKDYSRVEEMFTDTVKVSIRRGNADSVKTTNISSSQLVAVMKKLHQPEYEYVSDLKIKDIQILSDKAIVATDETLWMTVEGSRFKKRTQGLLTLIVEGFDIKITEVKDYAH
ncbi:hypothetical protein [Bacterioplanoides sp.]|uniref:hypothetical protein n=1 Tax=Bacterioplanoides sp. TaxID=2066072 RepID=UPI003B004EA7